MQTDIKQFGFGAMRHGGIKIVAITFLHFVYATQNIATAEFSYIPPVAATDAITLSNGSVMGTAQKQPFSRILRRLVPQELIIKYDRRVDAGEYIPHDYFDSWESLLHFKGLTWIHRNGELHIFQAGLSPDQLELISADEFKARWRVIAGESLEQTLERWGERAGVQVAYLTDRSYQITEDSVFHGTYQEAAFNLFFSLGYLPYPPLGELLNDGQMLAITHKSGGTQP